MKTLLLCMSLLLTGCATQRGFPPIQGIPNFDRVDFHVWRGAQPNRAGLEWLKSQGVTTVINLRGKDAWALEDEICAELGMTYHVLPLSGYSAPTIRDVEQVLQWIQQSPGIVFGHCIYGCDRTGTLVACYQIRQGMYYWDALDDAVFHGMSPLSVPMKEFIRRFK